MSSGDAVIERGETTLKSLIREHARSEEYRDACVKRVKQSSGMTYADYMAFHGEEKGIVDEDSFCSALNELEQEDLGESVLDATLCDSGDYEAPMFNDFTVDLAKFRADAASSRQTSIITSRKDSRKSSAEMTLYRAVELNRMPQSTSPIIVHVENDPEGHAFFRHVEMICGEIVKRASPSRWFGELELVLLCTARIMYETYSTPYSTLSARLVSIIEQERNSLPDGDIPSPENLFDMLLRRRGAAVLHDTVIREEEDPLVLLIADLPSRDTNNAQTAKSSSYPTQSRLRKSSSRARPVGSKSKRDVNPEF